MRRKLYEYDNQLLSTERGCSLSAIEENNKKSQINVINIEVNHLDLILHQMNNLVTNVDVHHFNELTTTIYIYIELM